MISLALVWPPRYWFWCWPLKSKLLKQTGGIWWNDLRALQVWDTSRGVSQIVRTQSPRLEQIQRKQVTCPSKGTSIFDKGRQPAYTYPHRRVLPLQMALLDKQSRRWPWHRRKHPPAPGHDVSTHRTQGPESSVILGANLTVRSCCINPAKILRIWILRISPAKEVAPTPSHHIWSLSTSQVPSNAWCLIGARLQVLRAQLMAWIEMCQAFPLDVWIW